MKKTKWCVCQWARRGSTENLFTVCEVKGLLVYVLTHTPETPKYVFTVCEGTLKCVCASACVCVCVCVCLCVCACAVWVCG